MPQIDKTPTAHRGFDILEVDFNASECSKPGPFKQATIPERAALAEFWQDRRGATVHQLHQRKYGKVADLSDTDVFDGVAT